MATQTKEATPFKIIKGLAIPPRAGGGARSELRVALEGMEAGDAIHVPLKDGEDSTSQRSSIAKMARTAIGTGCYQTRAQVLDGVDGVTVWRTE